MSLFGVWLESNEIKFGRCYFLVQVIYSKSFVYFIKKRK